MRYAAALLLAAGLLATTSAGCKAKVEKRADQKKPDQKKTDPREKWVVRATALAKSACACGDVACARRQQKALNNYILDSKGKQMDPERALKISKTMAEAQKCVSKTLLADKLKRLKKYEK